MIIKIILDDNPPYHAIGCSLTCFHSYQTFIYVEIIYENQSLSLRDRVMSAKNKINMKILKIY